MLLLARTFCLAHLASPHCGVLRPLALQVYSVVTKRSSSLRSRNNSVDMAERSVDKDTGVAGGGNDGGVIRPRVPVSSITAFGEGLGQEALQVTCFGHIMISL